nr:MAG TPA: Sodium/potassium-transporting ATPase subunit alpha-1 [Caudoviricetes sp.]
MNRKFLDYGNRQPFSSIKGILINLALWVFIAGFFALGMLINGNL